MYREFKMSDMSDTFQGKAADGLADPKALIVPTVVEKMGNAERAFDIYSKLLRDRIVILDGPVTQESASIIVNQLLYLDSVGTKDITLYINSPGGSVTAGMAIFDTMRSLHSDVSTLGLGMCASMGSFLLAAGTKGKRFALPNTRIMMHQPSAGTQGTVSDMKRAFNEFEKTKTRMDRLYQHFLGIDGEATERLLDRDTYINALTAKELGHIDQVIYKSHALELSEDDKALFALEMDMQREELANDKTLLEVIAHRKAAQAQNPAAPPQQPGAVIN